MVEAPNPDILGYNVGHLVAGGNAHDWWRYAGVNGARIFINPSSIEPDDDIPGRGDGVRDQAGFLERRAALRAAPLDPDYIDWRDFEYQYENRLFGTSTSGNRFTINYALGRLREFNIAILAQITGSESRFPISNEIDWAGKWELWQHFYAQAFYLGREFDVARYQMYNEPNHSNADGLTPENWLMRLQLASDAIQCALADVNAQYGASLKPLIYGPVNSGGADWYRGKGWGELAVARRHVNFLGESDPEFLVIHRYDYHEYNSSPASFGAHLDSLKTDLDADMFPEERFPTSLSEFNVHTNSNFDKIPETLDEPEKYARLGAIAVQLARSGLDEFWCFKFGQSGTSGDNYPVKKNGMHYVENGAAPFSFGGAAKAAEVWRLFVRAMRPGGSRLKYERDASLAAADQLTSYDPASGNYTVFSANNSESAIDLTVDVSALSIPEGAPFLLEEVSERRFGGARKWNTVSADGTLLNETDNVFEQSRNTVLLFTIPGRPLATEEVIAAREDATVFDGTLADLNFDGATDLFARNDPATADNRKASFIKFNLGVIYPPDIQLATLVLRARTGTGGSTVQGHLYGLDEDGWSADTITWKNAPNLLKGMPAGNTIRDRVIEGQGDSAHLQGQVVVSSVLAESHSINVTDFLKRQTDREVSFLLSQDPRWNTALPSLAIGDTQVDGLEVTSTEGGTPSESGPQLRMVRLLDSDHDGISDEAERTVFHTHPELPDSDGDGLSDGEEWCLGLDPTDAHSRYVIPTVKTGLDGGACRIEWLSIPGRTFTLSRSISLEAADWDSVHVTEGTGSVMRFSDPGSPSDRRFYRLQIQSPLNATETNSK